MLDFFYSLPIWLIFIIICMICPLWSILSNIYMKKGKNSVKYWYKINGVIFIISIILIVRYTIYGREYFRQELNLRPFSFLFEEGGKKEFLKEMSLNILLFIPFGLSLQDIIRGSVQKKILITILLATGISSIIEVLQYYFKVGWTEIDDIICNVTGAIIGSFSIIIKKALKESS